jgi:phosphoserine phosphatase RsbU/P
MSVLLRRAWRVASGRTAWLVIVLGLEVTLTVASIAVHGQYRLSAFMAIGPLMTCARCNARTTAIMTGCVFVLSAIVKCATLGTPAGSTEYPGFMVLAAGLVALLVALVRDRREARLIRIAENVQRAILRPLPAELGGFAFASQYHAATPGTLVGGDLYDLTMTQFGLRLIVGDVKGKGLDAVGRCAAVIGAFREYAFAEPDLTKLAEQMDTRLSVELGIEDFVTAVFAEFAEGEVRLVNCGHQPPVKVTAIDTVEKRGSLEVISPNPAVPPLGLQPRPARQDVPLKPGERLLFYTDGLVESRDRAGRFLALDERLAGALADAELEECAHGVARMLLQHTGQELGDDVLLVVCEPL